MSIARKIYGLLTPHERRQAFVLLGLMVIGMALETLGISLVIPAVALLVQSDPATAYPQLRGILASLGNPTHAQMVTFGMLALVGIYLVKALFLGFLAWHQNSVAFGVQRRISQDLFATYLRQPYTFHLQRNSAQLIRNAVNEVHQLWFLILNPTLVALSEGLVMLGITTLLFLVEPVGAMIVVSVLGAAAWGIQRYTHAHLARLG